MNKEKLEKYIQELKEDFIFESGNKLVTGWSQKQIDWFIKYLAEKLSNDNE